MVTASAWPSSARQGHWEKSWEALSHIEALSRAEVENLKAASKRAAVGALHGGTGQLAAAVRQAMRRYSEALLAGLVTEARTTTRSPEASRPPETARVAPGAVVRALSAARGTDTELFASLLNVHLHMRMRTYFTTHERNQLFGAVLDACSCRWTGACFAHHAEVKQKMKRVVHWGASQRTGSRKPTVMHLLRRG